MDRITIQIQVSFRANTQANIFLLNWVPGVGAAPGSDDAHGVSPTAVHFDGANMAREVDRVRGDALRDDNAAVLLRIASAFFFSWLDDRHA